MKLDINRAWTDAINLIQTNLSVVAVVAGVFFFLPYLAFVLFMPDVSAMGIESNPQDPTATFNQVMALYADIWWMVALLTVAQTIGTLALLALLLEDARGARENSSAAKRFVLSFDGTSASCSLARSPFADFAERASDSTKSVRCDSE